MDFLVFKELGIALILGTLIGLDREQHQHLFKKDSFGGLRTFALIGLMGALSFVLSKESMLLSLLLTGGFLALIMFAYSAMAKKNGSIGATSAIAAILVYMVGILCGMDEYLLATALALVLFSVLYFKKPLHFWAENLNSAEIVSTLEFIIIAFVVLPLLPNQGYGPYEIFNPYVIWLMVVFISGISFVSYIAIKIFGARKGIGLTGFLAGLISSTALALSFSAQSKRNEKIVNPYVFAIVIASSAMFFRILAEVAVLNRDLFADLLISLATMGITGLICASLLWFKRDHSVNEEMKGEVLNMKSPFSLRPALKFGVFFALILFVSKMASLYLGDRGVYLASVISGLMNVDAITVSVSDLANKGLDKEVAVTAITIAAMVNTLAKAGIFMIFGNRKVALKILAVFVLMLFAGGVSLFFV